MTPIFRPFADLLLRLGLIVAAALVLGGALLWWFWPRTDYAQHLAVAVPQPVPFSHKHHVAELGIDCRFCHASVEVTASAGMPPTTVCMTCHSQVWTNAAVLAPARYSLKRNTPLAWKRVADVPDYVYFDHRIHVAKGVGCESCHGAIATMALTYKAQPLTMAFCLRCHRDPAPQLRPREALFDTRWRRGPDTPSPSALAAQYHIPDRHLTECSLCHR